jgi:hypothetical protein
MVTERVGHGKPVHLAIWSFGHLDILSFGHWSAGRRPNAEMARCRNGQMLKWPDAQMTRCLNDQMPKYTALY